MKVLVIGGVGFFGSHLVALLEAGGHDVFIGRRSASNDPRVVSIDRQGPFDVLLGAGFDVVVDAAGPFQSAGAPEYGLQRFCIANGISCLDLSDDPHFTQGITALDAAARAAGVLVLSGLSSGPALSSAAIERLSADMDEVITIETAITPGNKTDRGVSVVHSILAQIGRKMQIWQGARWREAYAWGKQRAFTYPNGERRVGF